MFQEYDVVQVVSLLPGKHTKGSDYFFRPPLVGDVGTVVLIATANDQTGYFVECIADRAVTIWIDVFSADELAAIPVDAPTKFRASYGSNAAEVAQKAFQYYQRKRVVATAEAMLAGQLGIIAGSRQLTRLQRDVTTINLDPDFRIFVGIVSETDALPLGNQRRFWNPVALQTQDQEISKAEDHFRESALKGCRVLVARFNTGDDGMP